MTTPLVEDIAEDVRSTVDAITAAGGYNQDLTCIRLTSRQWRDGKTQVNGTVVLVQQDPDPDAQASYAGNAGAGAWRQPWALVAYVIDSDAAGTPMDTRLNQVRADIEKALMVDRQRGLRAIDTNILSPEFFDYGPGATGIIVAIEVLYRTDENDPYIQR